jgi:hypothetical protein
LISIRKKPNASMLRRGLTNSFSRGSALRRWSEVFPFGFCGVTIQGTTPKQMPGPGGPRYSVAALCFADNDGKTRAREDSVMPEKKTVRRARKDARQGKAPTTQAGEYVHEEMEHVKKGKHGVASKKQAIAIGLSKARRSGVKLKPPKAGKASGATRKKAQRDLAKGQTKKRSTTKKSTSKKTAAKRGGRSSAAKRSPAKKTGAASRKRRSTSRRSS